MRVSLDPRFGTDVLGVVLLAAGPLAIAMAAPQQTAPEGLADLQGRDTPWPGPREPQPVGELVADLASAAGIEVDLRVSQARADALASVSEDALTVGVALEELRNSQNLWYFVESPRRFVVLEAYQVGSTDTAPRPVRQVDPPYPRGQRDSGEEGEVWLEGLVMADGSVGWLRILREPNREFGEAAVASVRQWEFEPARHGGGAVNAVAIFTVTFRLRSQPL